MSNVWGRKPAVLEDTEALVLAYNEVLSKEKDTKW